MSDSSALSTQRYRGHLFNFYLRRKPTGLVEAMSVRGSVGLSVCDNLVREAFGVTIPAQMRLALTHMTYMTHYDSYD